MRNFITGSYWDSQPSLGMLIIKVVTEEYTELAGKFRSLFKRKMEAKRMQSGRV